MPKDSASIAGKEHPAIKKSFTPKRAGASDTNADLTQQPEISKTPTSTGKSRISTRNGTRRSYMETKDSDDEEFAIIHDGDGSDEDIFAAKYRGRNKITDNESESGKDSTRVLSTGKRNKTMGSKKRKLTAEFSGDESERFSKKTSNAKTTEKPAARRQRAPMIKKQDTPEDLHVQAIFESIPTVRPPTPPPRDMTKKFDFRANATRSQPAPDTGSKEMPDGAENCLAGLTFVFTGVLSALGRDDGLALVKRYGGRITSGPSSKTDYVILGIDAGPKKLETIANLKLKTINEDGLFALIRRLPANGGNGKAAIKAEEKRQAEEKKIQAEAERMEKAIAKAAEEKAKVAATALAASGRSPPVPKPLMDDQLWTVKYAPKEINQICGNKGQVEKLQQWLRKWQAGAKSNFKKGGPDGSGLYRAAIVYGGPGIGKTTAAHLVAKLEGYDVVESNASDTRSKKLIETGLKGVLDTTSLLGYFAGDGQKVDAARRKLVLIMDEVDGMSAGDRGGVGAMAAICKKTSIPIILICNERKIPKMKPFDHVTYEIPFRKPTTEQVRSRIMTILFRESMNKMIPSTVVNALIEGASSDIRRVINMISTAKLDQQTMDFDEGKRMTSAWEKNVILKPWDITQKILAGGLFSSSSNATLNEKIELYFNDHDFSPLMLQENYLITNPLLAGPYEGRKKSLKILDLVDKAAESISDGDLVDSMIHGAQQQWSLMPTHAVFSFVRPASFVAGGTNGRVAFTSWLGNNSKTSTSRPRLFYYVRLVTLIMRSQTFPLRERNPGAYAPPCVRRSA